MRRPANLFPLPLVACALLLGVAHVAARADEPADGATHWGLGLGVGVQQRPYLDESNKTRVLPLLFFDNRWIRAAGTGIDLKLPSAGPLSFALRATYSFDGYKPGDAPVLAGMAERKASFWLGATTTWHDPLADVSFELLGDASGHSKGQRAKLAIDHGFVFGSVELRPRVAVDWMDAKYVDYYYGVRAEEATAGRPEYRGKATFDPELGVRARYAFAPHQAAFLDVNSTRLGNEIANSPLVGRRTPTGVSLGYLYRF